MISAVNCSIDVTGILTNSLFSFLYPFPQIWFVSRVSQFSLFISRLFHLFITENEVSCNFDCKDGNIVKMFLETVIVTSSCLLITLLKSVISK